MAFSVKFLNLRDLRETPPQHTDSQPGSQGAWTLGRPWWRWIQGPKVALAAAGNDGLLRHLGPWYGHLGPKIMVFLVLFCVCLSIIN